MVIQLYLLLIIVQVQDLLMIPFFTLEVPIGSGTLRLLLMAGTCMLLWINRLLLPDQVLPILKSRDVPAAYKSLLSLAIILPIQEVLFLHIQTYPFQLYSIHVLQQVQTPLMLQVLIIIYGFHLLVLMETLLPK